jgi:hypothetical protein
MQCVFTLSYLDIFGNKKAKKRPKNEASPAKAGGLRICS